METAPAKRLRDSDDDDRNHLGEKSMRRLSSFGSVIKEAMAMRSLQSLLAMTEPMLRRVVREEVQRALVQGVRSMQISPHKQTIEPSSLRLVFPKRLSLPIFTASRIEDEESNPLRVSIEYSSGEKENLTQLPPSIKLEIVIVNGDFPLDEHEEWTAEEFERNIVRERAGKRPLLTGDVSVSMKGGVASIEDLVITDNSSWIRSRHFRIGARVARGSCDGLRIKEAITEKFTVKDHRGELYKKSYPPSLDDEVWRLERIGKDGAFHRRLSQAGIETVQGFLQQWVVDPHLLKRMLGPGMSDKTWETTTSHATTCVLGSKLYLYHKLGYVLLLNPICQVVRTILDGAEVSPRSLSGSQKTIVENLVLEAHTQWNNLVEVDEKLGWAAPMQTVMMRQGAVHQPLLSAPVQSAVAMPSYNASVGPDLVVDDATANGQADFGAWYSSPAGPNPASRNPRPTSTDPFSDDSIISPRSSEGVAWKSALFSFDALQVHKGCE